MAKRATTIITPKMIERKFAVEANLPWQVKRVSAAETTSVKALKIGNGKESNNDYCAKNDRAESLRRRLSSRVS